MNITEAVNAILKRYPDYGYDIFLDLNEIKDDDLQEVVRFIASMRRHYHTNPKRSRKINRETLKDMIKKGYTYKGIARETGLAESTVGTKILNYGLGKLYHQMRPRGIRAGVQVICLNIETGEQKMFEFIGKAERAFNFKEGYLSDKTKDGKCYVESGWEFRRAD
jgi:uncharacterized protein YerC